jgi:hypothetical protein
VKFSYEMLPEQPVPTLLEIVEQIDKLGFHACYSADEREIGPPRSPGRTPFGATIEERSALWRQLEENDRATLERHCELWESKHGDRVSVPTMWRAVRKLGWSKKRGRWEPPKERKITEVLGESA